MDYVTDSAKEGCSDDEQVWRPLAKEDSARLWRALETVWRVDGSGWYPMNSQSTPPGVLAFHTDYFFHGDPQREDPGDFLIQALEELV